jgi:hypothetical protein
MESKVHSANQKSGHHFIYLDDYDIQKTNEQTIRVQCGTN